LITGNVPGKAASTNDTCQGNPAFVIRGSVARVIVGVGVVMVVRVVEEEK